MNKISAKVQAVNKCRAEVNRVAPLFIAAALPFIGKKVQKIGGLMENFKKHLPIEQVKAFHHYRQNSEYSLYYTIKEMVPEGDCGCCYHEETFCFGEVKDGIMTKTVDFAPLKCDYTAEQVRQLQKAVEDADTALRQAQNNLFPFSRHIY